MSSGQESAGAGASAGPGRSGDQAGFGRSGDQAGPGRTGDQAGFGRNAEEEPPVVIRDKRRLFPDGSARTPDPVVGSDAAAPVAPGAAAPVSGPDPAVAELTETLQRLKAEYDNYRRRAERDRAGYGDIAVAGVLAQLLPVLDDVDRARAHGDLTGAFATVGTALVGITTKLGLEAYGVAGEPFDPQVHEAVMAAAPSADAEVATVVDVFSPGYRHAGRTLRPAQVSVAEPAGPPAVPTEAPGGDAAPEQGTAPTA